MMEEPPAGAQSGHDMSEQQAASKMPFPPDGQGPWRRLQGLNPTLGQPQRITLPHHSPLLPVSLVTSFPANVGLSEQGGAE